MMRWLWVLIWLVLTACSPQQSAQTAENPLLKQLLTAAQTNGHPRFASVAPGVQITFPRDHGNHSAQRLEWWYVTGNLQSATNPARRFGFQLTFFRLSQAPGADPLQRSQAMMAHFALTDMQQQRYQSFERLAWRDQEIAGVAPEASDSDASVPLSLWLDDWQLRGLTPELKNIELSAQQHGESSAQDYSLALTLQRVGDFVLQGERGYSKKSSGGSASAYYSAPRWRSTGTLTFAGERFEVAGLSWLDREWSSDQLSAEQSGWRWFALHLEDGSDVMLYLLMQGEKIDALSAGSRRFADGRVQYFKRVDIQALVRKRWQGYPIAWTLRLPELGEIQVDPAVDAQLFGDQNTLFRYWEGAVAVRRGAQQELVGRGYLEVTQ